MKTALIHYFSGTGNTYHMVNILGESLRQQGYDVQYSNMEKPRERMWEECSLHVFCYPIYAFGTPAIVLRYIRSLKKISGRKAAIVCSYGGFEGQSLTHMSMLLRRKGLDVFLTDAALYPDNWTQVVNPKEEEEQRAMMEKADHEMGLLGQKIASLETGIKKRGLLNLAWSWVVFSLFTALGRRIMGKVFIADSTCISCGKCERTCPVSTIKIKNGRPFWGWKCENCERCMNICPKRSIQTSGFKLITYLVLSIGLIFLQIWINSAIHLHTLLNVLSYCMLYIISVFFMDLMFRVLEKLPTLRKILTYSYTQKYRRYMVKEFKDKFKIIK